ncbi:MAG: carbohydrate ABC transporter permease, partial [Angelakisella sp.]
MKKGIFKKRINRSIGGNLAIFVCLALLGATLALPLVYIVNAAFKPMDELFIFPPSIFVKHPTTDNFIKLGQITASSWVPLSRYIFNSVFVSTLATVGHLLFASMAAYPLAKHDFVGKKVLNGIVRLALLFTPAVTAIPLYLVMSSLHLINTYASLILPSIASTLGLYLMQNFMVNIPDSMLEAARLDGAGEFSIYARVVMPNVKPAAITMVIFAFNAIWNSNGGAFVYEEKLKVLPAALSQITSGGTGDAVARAGVAAAVLLILMIPPMIIFLFTQNKVIETMT